MKASDPAARQARIGGLLLGVAALLALLAHVRIDGGLIDDAFITFRYAANLAEGRGMLYNPGERVLGTTTPAWAGLLGAAGTLVGAGAIPTVARVLNGFLVVAGGLVAARLARALGGGFLVAGLAGATVMLVPHNLMSGVSGMETPLLNLLVLLALLGWADGRWLLAAGAAGFAPLVRPEGGLIAAVVGVAWLLVMARRRHAREDAAARSRFLLVVPGLLVLPGLLLLAGIRAWYGGWVPQSIVAKRAGIYPLTLGESARETVGALARALTGAPLLDAAPGAYLLGLAGGTVWLLRRHRPLWPAAVLLWGYLAFYATSGTLIFPHYIALIEPFALAAWGGAAWALASWATRMVRRPSPEDVAPDDARRRARPWAVGAVGAFVLVTPLRAYPGASVLRGEPALEDVVVGLPALRMAFYHVAAETVGPAIPEGTTVLMPEIGVLGFRLPHVRVLDAAGLVSPEAVAFLPVPAAERIGAGVGAVPSGLARAEMPELIMTLELFARLSVYEDPWFAERYETVWLWRAPELVWGPLRIHARRGSEVGARLRELPGGVGAGG